MNNLKVGNVVKYTNEDGESKLAIVTENIAGEYYNAIRFSGGTVKLGIGDKLWHAVDGDITNLCARTLDEYLTLHNVRTVTFTRDCAANLDGEPVMGFRQGGTLTGDFRAEGHPKNLYDGCVEIDTPKGTYAFPADAI